MQGNISYEITVVDTVGFFDTHAGTIGFNNFCDDFEAYMKDSIDIDRIIILFVLRKGCLTHEEQAVFALFKHIERISSFSALAITGCENDTTKRRAVYTCCRVWSR